MMAADYPVVLRNLTDLRLVELPQYAEENGELVVMEALRHVPFSIARAFTVRASLDAVRGRHAHRRCAQFLVCVSGAVEVICEDGVGKRAVVLDRPNLGLMVPPSIWVTVLYRRMDSVLLVLCDRNYEPEDYIRDHADFEAFRASGGISNRRSK